MLLYEDYTLEFDALEMLTNPKGGPTGNLSSQTYTYDRYGNRTSVTATGVAADNSTMPSDGIPNLAYDNTSNRITTAGFEYDVAGNQTRALAEDGVTWVKYEYDAANRLHVVKRASDDVYLQAFQFGSTNARLMDTDYGTGFTRMFASVGGTVLAEYHENYQTPLTWIKSYIFLGERLLSTTAPNGTGGEYTEYNHPDKLSTRLITNGLNSYEQTHLPFGTALNAESTGSINRRFTSYDRSNATGLDYAVNRTYDSKQGRFTQVDPIGNRASTLELPQTLNLYTYCGNDPVNFTDPDGLFWGAIGKFFKKLGKIFSAIGRAINRVLSNIAVRIAIMVLAAIVTLGTSLIGTLSVLMPSLTIPTWLTVATYISTGISWASKIGSALELGGLLLQGKFKQVGKIIGLAFVGALVGVIEDSIVNGAYDAWKKGGNIFAGAWRGFKRGLGFIADSFKRFGSKKWWEGFFPVYGFFCAPGWGAGYATDAETAVDGRDSACEAHDRQLKKLKGGLLPGRTVTGLDVDIIMSSLISTSRPRFTDIAFGSGGRIGDRFGFTVPFAFGIRIAKNRGR